jgi:glutamate mutase epsilon subunit
VSNSVQAGKWFGGWLRRLRKNYGISTKGLEIFVYLSKNKVFMRSLSVQEFYKLPRAAMSSLSKNKNVVLTSKGKEFMQAVTEVQEQYKKNVQFSIFPHRFFCRGIYGFTNNSNSNT